MKFSNVFKTFSDSILLPNKGEHVLPFNSKEYARAEMSDNNNRELKNLEEQLHLGRKPSIIHIQDMIQAPNYGTPETFEKVFATGLFMDSISSTDAENKEVQQNMENKIEDNSHRNNVKSTTYFVPDTTYNTNNINDHELNDGQWEADLENEKHKQYYSNKNVKRNKFNITVMIPVNTTVQRYMGYARRKVVPTEKPVLHFYDAPFNRIEEISKEDDSSVLAIR